MECLRSLEGVVRILVTGATGFIGQHLVRHLLQNNQEVILCLRESYSQGVPWPPALAQVRLDVEVVYADLRNYRLTVRGIKQANPEIVFHLAAAGVSNPFLPLETALRHNLYGTLHIIRAAFESRQSSGRVQRLVVARTPGERTSMNVYATSKAAAWQFCQFYARIHQWPIVGGMIFQAYGPGQPEHTLIPAAIAAARAGNDFPMTAGTQQRDWIYSADVAAGLATLGTAALPPGRTLDLGTGRLTSVRAVVEQIYALAGGNGRPLTGVLAARPGEEKAQVANAAQTTHLTGWQAQIPLQEGLHRLLSAG